MNTYKETLNRVNGCGMNLIKFHLPCHFADDMLRFGSMLNFDTGIGESHHKTEAKQPAKNTQRRKNDFELQAAHQQTDNVVIDRAINNNRKNQISKDTDKNLLIVNKWFRYRYTTKHELIAKDTKMACKLRDYMFQQQLSDICKIVVSNNYLSGDLKFFTQHNRYGNIFRADPNYKNEMAWYDWVLIQWDNDHIPAKLLIFWDISEHQFIQPFKIGNSSIPYPGQYAIIYSPLSSSIIQPAHLASNLIQYGILEINEKSEPVISIVDVESIYSPLSGLPYKSEESIINAREWLFLKPRHQWYEIFIGFVSTTLSSYKQPKGISGIRRGKTTKKRSFDEI